MPNCRFKPKKIIEDFNPLWVDSLKLILPCKNVPVPKRTMRLPNAPRKYRNGIHKGVDIVVPFMTPVYASLDGVIVVANTEYQDVDLLTYERFLKTTDLIQKTP